MIEGDGIQASPLSHQRAATWASQQDPGPLKGKKIYNLQKIMVDGKQQGVPITLVMKPARRGGVRIFAGPRTGFAKEFSNMK